MNTRVKLTWCLQSSARSLWLKGLPTLYQPLPLPSYFCHFRVYLGGKWGLSDCSLISIHLVIRPTHLYCLALAHGVRENA